jgi:hypothetical protein
MLFEDLGDADEAALQRLPRITSKDRPSSIVPTGWPQCTSFLHQLGRVW